MKRLFSSIFSKKNANEGEEGKIAAQRAQPVASIPSNTKPNSETNARPVVTASLSPPRPQLQWTKGPDPVVATTESVPPLPRARPTEAGSNAALASLPLNGRKVASAGDVTASLPLAITGGEKPSTALAYAAPEAVPQRMSAPVAQQAAAATPRSRPQDIARPQEPAEPASSPGLYGDAAHSPSILFSKGPVQLTADLRHPDQSGLVILLDPAATTAGYFAHQSGGKIVTGALTSAY
jgi:hypothetical protein